MSLLLLIYYLTIVCLNWFVSCTQINYKDKYFVTTIFCGIGLKQISEHRVALIQITPTFWEVSSSSDKYLSRNEQQQQQQLDL